MPIYRRLPLVALLVLAGCRSGADGDGLRLVDVDGVEDLTNDLRRLDARAVVVNVWATWCGPCIVEFPEFVRYDRAMSGQGVEVRFLSVDDLGVRPRVEAFLREHGWEKTAYLATSHDVVQGLAFAGHTMWDSSIPITFILDGEGVVRDMWVGMTTYDLLAARVDRVLAAPPRDATAAR